MAMEHKYVSSAPCDRSTPLGGLSSKSVLMMGSQVFVYEIVPVMLNVLFDHGGLDRCTRSYSYRVHLRTHFHHLPIDQACKNSWVEERQQ